MKTKITLLLLSVAIYSCKNTQVAENSNKGTESKILNADHFLITESQTKTMLLGTWHFAYPNADSHKVAEEDMVDLSSEKKQKEIVEVVERLAAFDPTIICIESQNQSRIDSLYSAYRQGKHQLDIAEEEQIGFRLGKRLGLRKIYAIDCYSWLREEYDDFPILESLWDDEYYLDTLDMIKWGEKYSKLYNYEDQIVSDYTVDECLRYHNDPENLKRSLGHYLVELKTSNHNGPDALALKWYNRNVRIFNNILKTNPKTEDRILAIYGASHVTILEQLFDASPQFDLVRPYDY